MAMIQKLIPVFAILPFEFNESEPRHHNFHLSLEKSLSEITYITLKDQRYLSQFQANILPKSSTWSKPIFGIRTLIKLKTCLKPSMLHQSSLSYIYEGSFSWAYLLAVINYFGRLRTHFVVNIFPSQDFFTKFFKNKHSRQIKLSTFVFIIERLRDMNIFITFDNSDAQIIPRELKANIYEFPLFSSISKVPTQKHSINHHANVLLLERNFIVEDLSVLIEESCKLCNFYVSRPDSKSFNSATNFHLFPDVIPINQYFSTLSKFDYAIFLYDVENNSSGKILDFCQLGTPVCIPKVNNYLARAAKTSVPYIEFDLHDRESIKFLFDHPRFNVPNEENDWGPETFPDRLLALTEIESKGLRKRRILRFFLASTFLFYVSISRFIFVLQLIHERLRRFSSYD